MDSSPIRYMYCEVHKDKLLKGRKGARNPYQHDNLDEFLPAFFCDECNRYYINATKSGIMTSRNTGKIMPQSQVPIYTTTNTVYNRHPGIEDVTKTKERMNIEEQLIDNLFLPIRTYNQLIKAKIYTYKDLYMRLEKGIDSMLSIQGLTAVDIAEIALAVKNIDPEEESKFRKNNREKVMRCPEHNRQILKSTTIIYDFMSPQGGYSYFFSCPLCKRYYFNSNCGKKGTFKTAKRTVERGTEVWVTDSIVSDVGSISD